MKHHGMTTSTHCYPVLILIFMHNKQLAKEFLFILKDKLRDSCELLQRCTHKHTHTQQAVSLTFRSPHLKARDTPETKRTENTSSRLTRFFLSPSRSSSSRHSTPPSLHLSHLLSSCFALLFHESQLLSALIPSSPPIYLATTSSLLAVLLHHPFLLLH